MVSFYLLKINRIINVHLSTAVAFQNSKDLKCSTIKLTNNYSFKYYLGNLTFIEIKRTIYLFSFADFTELLVSWFANVLNLNENMRVFSYNFSEVSTNISSPALPDMI